MKKLIFMVATLATCLFSPAFAKNQDKSSNIAPLLTSYYNIKDALVNSNGALVKENAASFLKTINTVDMKTLTTEEMNGFMSFKDKLVMDATQISESKNIAQQRTYFASLSGNFYKLVKAANFNSEVIYYDYCPMKKSYWLSAVATIKNPYFGNQMLTCGKIAESIKK